MFTMAWKDFPQPPEYLEGRPFTALLLEDDSKRACALSILLSNLQQPDVRVLRMGNSVRSRLTLEHILLQVTEPDANSSLADNTCRIARAIAERRGQETSVVLLITQAETLHSRTLRLLQDMAPYFAEGAAPTLQVVFVGRPAFRDLLQARDMTPLREALGFPAYTKTPDPSMDDDFLDTQAAAEFSKLTSMASMASTAEQAASEPVLRPSLPKRRGSLAARSMLLLIVVTVGVGLGYLGAQVLPHQNLPTPRGLNAFPSTETQAAPDAQPPPMSTIPTPIPDALQPVPPTPVLPAPALAPRPIPVKQRSIDDGASPNLASTSNPRVVIHVPAGSEATAALSAHVLASLGSRPGTVELRRVAETPNRPNIRYFHPEDEAIARQVATQMADTGLPWTLRDFSTFLPRPSRGTIEVWLPRL